MKKQATTFLLMMFLGTMIPMTSHAQRGMGFGYDRQNQRNDDCRLGVIIPDLSEDQAEQLKALRLQNLESRQKYRNEMGEIRARQRTLMSESPINEKAMSDLIDRKAALMKDHQKAVLNHQLAIRNILTEDQVLVLNQRMNQRRGMYGRPGFRQGAGRGAAAYGGRRAYGGRGLGPCGAGYGPGYRGRW